MSSKNWRKGGAIGGSIRAAPRPDSKFSNIPLPELGADNTDETAANANLARTFAEIAKKNELDLQMGFASFVSGPIRIGWMLNMQTTLIHDGEWPGGRSAVDYYFMAEDGSCFKATLTYSPYFFVKCRRGTENGVEEYLRRRFGNAIESTLNVIKEDLDLPNHLSGVKRNYLRLNFRNMNDLMAVRRILLPIAIKNGEGYKDGVMGGNYFDDPMAAGDYVERKTEHGTLANIVGLREYDIPYHLRVGIDLDIRVGLWYAIQPQGPNMSIAKLASKDVRPDPVVLAFDIETSKMPLKFPDANHDHIMMISYMINGNGYLIVNRDIVSQDIEDFEYTPKPDFPGQFSVVNVPHEQALLNHFFSHIQIVRPQIFVSYNGDFFDWPFLDTRSRNYGLSMEDCIGIAKNSQGEWCTTYGVHMDCFCWVKRDSYLPAGSHGLKSVCSIKLGYDPLELDPELMTPLASSDPQTLANYSVSDAVATYYLYMKYVHPFIFSLCNIIPLMPDEVLRKGTGTLCETLLMAQAYKANVIMPNKQEDAKEKFYKGHLLDSETYIGGHVEALEAGVYRSDFQYRFKINIATMEQLIDDLDRAFTFFIEHESKAKVSDVKNYDEIKHKISSMLQALAETPVKMDNPLIYHLDVGSMYPNIILTNRLQPSAMVEESTCAVCDFNKPGKQCQRKMSWSWRGEFFSAKQSDYRMIKKQLESERFPSKHTQGETVPYHELSAAEQTALLKKRLADYSQKVYKRTRTSETVQKTAMVCQRENSFYVDTVRSFRDRRYDYKNLQKVSKKKLEEAQIAKDPAKIEEAGKLIVLYDSLQLAHKCILNSFYGYVMRKAARWYSMEMGGIVCETGAAIITLARKLIEQFGRPLELDTDGIWCMLPSGFPQSFTFELANGKKLSFDYPCVMLNHLLFDKFTNHQYQTLVNTSEKTYSISSENSIFFEIDGPYKAMVLPSSTEEGRQLKKRYAVFNEDGSLAELKGFEIKRRGELKLIKIFQSQIFKTFLAGNNLSECYQEVATIANYWLDVLYSRGAALDDTELIELISENRSMSKSLEDYGEQKSTSISTARRLAEFLGDQMVKDKGLACKFIISAKPHGLPVTNRAIPVAIFSAAPEVRCHYLGKWLKDFSMSQADIREIIDWEYYLERIGSMIQKLIVIPAAMQQVPNPVPRVIPPEWLKRQATCRSTGSLEQRKLTDMFVVQKRALGAETDLSVTATVIPVTGPGGLVAAGLGTSAPQRDMEDIVSKKLKSNSLQNERTETKSVITCSLDDLRAALPGINPYEDYCNWLKSRKDYWKAIRGLVKSKKRHLPDRSISKQQKFISWVDQDRESIYRHPWHIISMKAVEERLGEFKLWVLVGGALRNFRLVVPRRIFFSTRTPMDGATRVHQRLPDGSSAKNLYELAMNEPIFQNAFVTNSAALLDPMLESLWETDIPLDWQALIKLGSLVTVNRKVRSAKDNPADVPFQLDELDFKSTSETPYLGGDKLDIVFAYMGHINADNRHLLLVYLPDSPTIRFFVVDPGLHRQLTGLKSLYQQVVKSPQSIGFQSLVDYLGLSEEREFEIDYFADFDGALRSVNRMLNGYFDSRPKATVFLLHPTRTSNQNAPKGILFAELMEKVPVIQVNPSTLAPFILPPLDWQRSGARRLLDVLVALNPWVRDRLTLAGFAHVPLDNLPDKDESIFISDLFFCRHLRNSGYLIPWQAGKSSLLPKVSETEANPNNFALIPFEKRGNIDRPGLYKTVCVDMQLQRLALNALTEHLSLVSDGEEVPPLFSMLRSLVGNWLKEAHYGNPMAVTLIHGFLRWIRSGSSRVLSTSLLDHLLRTIERVQAMLHVHIRQLGCTIVHSDNHRLLIATSKTNRVNAEAFIEYLQNDLKQTDGLAWISFDGPTYWQTLLWVDSANFAGIIARDSEEGDEGKHSVVSCRWNLAEYLPPMLSKSFIKLIAEYVTIAHNRPNRPQDNADAPEAGADGGGEMKDGNATAHQHSLLINDAQDGQDDGESMNTDEEMLPTKFVHLFLAMVRDMQKRMTGLPTSPSDAQLRAFPVRVGSHIKDLDNGSLHFVKFVGAILGHDRSISSSIFKMIKSAYALLGVGEFSDEATFIDPCRSFTLKDIVCSKCDHVRDLDFCRDEDVLRIMTSSLSPDSPSNYQTQLPCPNCHHPYDLHLIEEEMVSQVRHDLLLYQRQDLICLRCKQVKADCLAPLCGCSGKFRLEYTPDQFCDKLRVLQRIAAALRLSTLQYFIDSINAI